MATDQEENKKKEGDIFEHLKKELKNMRFGTIQLVVHGSRVVQIDKTEKIRLDKTDTRD